MQDFAACCAGVGSAPELGGVDWEDEVGRDVLSLLEDSCVALYSNG